jgi:hypothetical protein
MSGYTKLFSHMLDSTIWRENDHTRLLWVTMLAMVDQDGIVQSSIPGLADRARISIEDCEAGLKRFQQPDKYSRSPEAEGRRIRTVDGGWLLINHGKYRALMSVEDQKEKARIRKQNQRSRNKQRDMSHSVTPGHECHDIAEAKADTKAEADTDPNSDVHIQNQIPETSLSEQNGCSDKARFLPCAKSRKELSPEASRLAAQLKQAILRNKPDFRIKLTQESNWAVTAQRMIEIDKRDPNEIAELIDWSQNDDFWKANILSMDKLREKFDQLQMKRKQDKATRAKARQPVLHTGFDKIDYRAGLEENADGTFQI